MAIASGVRRFYEFGLFRLDPIRRRLSRDGKFVTLYPKAVEALIILVEHSGEILEREALMNALWPGTIVEESNLTVAVSHLRKVLNGNGDGAEFIQTIPRVGYRFVADVREVAEEPASLVGKSDRQVGDIENSDADENGAKVPEEQSPRQPAIVAPAQVKRQTHAKTTWLLGGLIVAIVLAFAGLFLIRYRSSHASVQAPTQSPRAGTVLSAPAPIPEKSIAVLPFANLSDDKQNTSFADGVQDDLLTKLAKIADLKVISRRSVMQYRSPNILGGRNAREIGDTLRVSHVLEGSVRKTGGGLHVNVQLVDTLAETNVWAEQYYRDLKDVFAVESEIAQKVAQQLHANITAAERLAIERPPTTDLTAFDLYSRAKNLLLTTGMGSNAKASLLQAADLLNQAVTHDATFFDAYCQLAWTHEQLYFLGFDHTSARLAQAETAIDIAFRLRPDAAEAHLARAENLYRGHLDYNGALAELELARKTLPNDPRVFELEGYVQRRQGHWEESMRNFERAVDVDPRNFFTLQQLARTYTQLRRYAEEKSALDRAMAIASDDVGTRVRRAFVDLDWKADTRPLHETIDSIRATNPAAIVDAAGSWLMCALAERDEAAAKAALVAMGETPLSDEAVKFNHPFVEGVIARMMKDDNKAQAAFSAARAEQEKIIQGQPNYAPTLCVLGLIDAALGRKEDALREGRSAVDLLPVEKDAINGPVIIGYFAMIAAWAGDIDLACEQLIAATRVPGSLSYGQLKLLPWWDPLRGDPRFEAIVTSLAPKDTNLETGKR